MGRLGLFSVTNLLLIRMPREFYKESWLNPHKLNLSCTQRSLFQNSKIEPSKELTFNESLNCSFEKERDGT